VRDVAPPHTAHAHAAPQKAHPTPEKGCAGAPSQRGEDLISIVALCSARIPHTSPRATLSTRTILLAAEVTVVWQYLDKGL
jgi:hypothetical protein